MLIPDVFHDVLYGQYVAGGDISPHNMPPPSPCHQIEADDVWYMEADFLNGKVIRLAVDYRDSSVMSAWRRRRRHQKSYGLSRVNIICYLGLMQNSNINLPLRHPIKC